MALRKNQTILVVAADRGKAKIYKWTTENKLLSEVHSLTNESVRKPERDLRADRPGHGQGFNSQIQYSMDEHVSYKQQESALFIKSLAQYISKKDTSSDFDTMIVVAPIEVYNMLTKNLQPKIVDKIKKHHAKILTNMSLGDFQTYFKKYII